MAYPSEKLGPPGDARRGPYRADGMSARPIHICDEMIYEIPDWSGQSPSQGDLGNAAMSDRTYLLLIDYASG